MAKKPLSGAAYFEALGRRDCSLGIPLFYRYGQYKNWPIWAQDAYQRGRINQTEIAKEIPKGKYVFNDPIDTVK